MSFMSEQWFAASMRLVVLVEGEGQTKEDEVAHVFRADGWELAFERALALGRGHETEYVNDDGVGVRWRLERVLTLDELRVADLDGAEVYSALREVESDTPFDTTFSPAEHRPDQSGI
jgi:hypothetical protein